MKIARIGGIDIVVHPSWVFIFALVAWSLGRPEGPLHVIEAGPRALLAGVIGLGVFASVLVHELAHSLVARRNGLAVDSITLFIFGGVSSIKDAPGARVEALVALVGPLTSLALGFVFTTLAQFAALSPTGMALQFLGSANYVLAAFNLLPAYPLDGGRVLRALLWWRLGDRLRATRAAIVTARAIAVLLVILGVAEALYIDMISGIWTTLIAWLLWQAGESELLGAELKFELRGHTARELAVPGSMPVTAPAETPLSEALDLMVAAHQRALLVTRDGALTGLVSLTDLVKMRNASGPTPIGDIMTPRSELHTFSANAPAMDALNALASSGYEQMPLLESDGSLAGFLTRSDAFRWLSLRHERARLMPSAP